MKILVLTTEPLPLPGLPATGAGLRAWGLAFGLRAAGFQDVEIGFAADSVRDRDVDTSVVPGVSIFERGELTSYIRQRDPDAIVLQHWGLGRWFPEVKCPAAIDLAGPHLLERRLWGSRDPGADYREKIETLARMDYAVCSGKFQRHYFLPFLFQAGFEAESGLCPVIPFSVSPSPPSANPQRDLTAFVYGGFFLPWQDPSDALEWTLESFEKRGKGSLHVIGGPHPGGDVSGGRYESLLEKLDGSERVTRVSPLPFDEYLNVLRQSGTAIDLMPRNPERELAFPTRTLIYLWAGLPVIHNNYDELADPIKNARAGWTLDAGDKRSLQKLVERLVSHTEDVERRGENARQLALDKYTWDKTIEPLAEWCRDPKPRRDKRPVLVAVPGEKETKYSAASRKPRVTYSPPPPVAGPNRLQQVLSPLAFLVALPIALVLLLLFGLAEVVRLFVRGR